MKQLVLTIFSLSIVFIIGAVLPVNAQQPATGEKQDLVTKFRKLTGADVVNLGINVSFEDIKNDLVGTVDVDNELTDSQKVELRKSALEAYDRLDKQLKDFLNDRPKITAISESIVFQIYDQAFTEAELRELVAFYGTPTGQKAARFLPTLSAQVQKAFQSVLRPKIQEFIAPKIKAEGDQLKQKIQETKAKKP